MTTKPRRPRRTTQPATDTAPEQAAGTMPESIPLDNPVVPQPERMRGPESIQLPEQPRRVDTVQDRLDALSAYADHDGLVPVIVRVSHDGVYEGQHTRVPVSDRFAGLIEIGFLEVDQPDPAVDLR